MKTLLRFLNNLALIVWLGGIFTFGAITAPAVFMMMGYVKDGNTFAGMIVGQALYGLHSLAQVCAVLLLLTSLFLRRKLFSAENLMIVIMLTLTCVSQYGITPRIQAVRASVQSLDTLAPDDSRKVEFNKLHKLSTATEGVIFGLGIVIVGLRSAKDE